METSRNEWYIYKCCNINKCKILRSNGKNCKLNIFYDKPQAGSKKLKYLARHIYVAGSNSYALACLLHHGPNIRNFAFLRNGSLRTRLPIYFTILRISMRIKYYWSLIELFCANVFIFILSLFHSEQWKSCFSHLINLASSLDFTFFSSVLELNRRAILCTTRVLFIFDLLMKWSCQVVTVKRCT